MHIPYKYTYWIIVNTKWYTLYNIQYTLYTVYSVQLKIAIYTGYQKWCYNYSLYTMNTPQKLYKNTETELYCFHKRLSTATWFVLSCF